MGNTHHPMVKTLSRISGYAPYSKEAFGTPEITPRNLTEAEIDALVVLMPALEGQGYEDTPPASFPQ